MKKKFNTQQTDSHIRMLHAQPAVIENEVLLAAPFGFPENPEMMQPLCVCASLKIPRRADDGTSLATCTAPVNPRLFKVIACQ